VEELMAEVEDMPDAAAPEPSPELTTVIVDTPERSRPPSTASYEEAMSKPEPVDIQDGHLHLTDAQLAGPTRGVLSGCRVPSNARVTIKIAVQNGRAIGVTVDVRFVRPRSARLPSRAATQAEARIAARIAACGGRRVRAIVWPPSRRRDAFTTEF
jgi:hypothetical protein